MIQQIRKPRLNENAPLSEAVGRHQTLFDIVIWRYHMACSKATVSISVRPWIGYPGIYSYVA